MYKSRSGFTIVELLIVIVVIAILAAISVAAYTGIQQRSRDSHRMQAVSGIRKALELYKIDNDRYPAAIGNVAYASWDVSPGSTWLNNIGDYLPTRPVDPINNSDHFIGYAVSVAGQHGCPATAGNFYVLRVVGLERVDGREVSDLGACSGSTTMSATRTPTQTQAVFFGFENQ